MSLRDQLLAKGLVTKKQARSVNRDLRKKRKKKQGSRRKSKVEEREAKANDAARREAETEERHQARRIAATEREAHERSHRIRQIIESNRMASRGPVVFHHRIPQSSRIGRLALSRRAAFDLRRGRLGIVQHGEDEELSFVVVARRAVEKLMELAPDRVAFLVDDTQNLVDPGEQFLEPQWDLSLTPLRVWPAPLQPHRVPEWVQERIARLASSEGDITETRPPSHTDA